MKNSSDEQRASFDAVPSENGFPRYSAAEMARRHGALQEIMEAEGVQVVLITGATTGLETPVQYFSNWPPRQESFVLFPREGDPSLVMRLWNHLPDARRISTIDDVQYGGDTVEAQAIAVSEMLQKRNLGNQPIGFIGQLAYSTWLVLSRNLPHAQWRDLSSAYQRLRMVKSEEELIYTRIAAQMTDDAVAALEREIKPGLREYELAPIFENAYLARRGLNQIHFVASTPMRNPEVCVPHQYHSDRCLVKGDVIVTEVSTTFWGYTGQALRSFTLQEDPTPLYQELYDVARAAYDEIVSVLRKGVTVGEILDKSELIDKAGFTIYDDLVHGYGGGYLPPILRTRGSRGSIGSETFEYPENAVIVVQPNVITQDEMAGVQIGNAVRLTKEGFEVLQNHPMDFVRCG